MSNIRSLLRALFFQPNVEKETLPKFPNFKPLEILDKKIIEAITNKFPPYSDFNFLSLWSWNIQGETRISQLHGNLVVRFTDYLTGQPFYSFLGNNRINDTVNALFELSREEKIPQILKLIPEDSIKNLDKNRFKLEEDRDNFDYIYPIEKLKTYDGNKLRGRRNFCNRFKNKYSAKVKIIEIPNQDVILSLFLLWAKNKGRTPDEVKNEQEALKKCLLIKNNADIIIIGIFIKEELIAFSICDVLRPKYVILHFEKADERYEGIYSFLMQENAKIFSVNGFKYINFEQDLGIPGLRLSKKSFYPAFFLKKYTIKNFS